MSNERQTSAAVRRAPPARAAATPGDGSAIASALPAGGASGIPLYRELQRRLTRALSEGTWKPGEALPSESRLAQQYGVSIGTVRKAIEEGRLKGSETLPAAMTLKVGGIALEVTFDGELKLD